MSTDEREKALEAWKAKVVQWAKEDGYEIDWGSVAESDFEAGYDALVPEIERLRAELKHAKDGWTHTANELSGCESMLATARERVAELEHRRIVCPACLETATTTPYAEAVERAEHAEARVLELEGAVLALEAGQAAAIEDAEQAERERDEVRKVVEAVLQVVENEMRYFEQPKMALVRIRALLAPKETNSGR